MFLQKVSLRHLNFNQMSQQKATTNRTDSKIRNQPELAAGEAYPTTLRHPTPEARSLFLQKVSLRHLKSFIRCLLQKVTANQTDFKIRNQPELAVGETQPTTLRHPTPKERKAYAKTLYQSPVCNEPGSHKSGQSSLNEAIHPEQASSSSSHGTPVTDRS